MKSRVTGIEFSKPEITYDLEVEDNHNFYVNNTLVHNSAAPAFARFLSELDCKYRMGLSATIIRKDSRSVLLPELLGPIVAKAKSSSLIPTIKLVETGLTAKYNYRTWVHAMQFLARNKPRTKLVLEHVERDYNNGHKCIIIPVDFKNHAFALKKELDELAEKRGWITPFAQVFHAGCDRKKILADVDRGKIPVLIAIRSMISMGIDLSLPSMLYIVVPMSGNSEAGAPMFYQLSHRVATWMKNKKPPVVKVFIDGLPQSSGCFRSMFWKEIYPNLEGKAKEPRYKMLDSDYQRAMMVAGARPKYIPINDPGVRMTSKQILTKTGTPTKAQSSRVNYKRGAF